MDTSLYAVIVLPLFLAGIIVVLWLTEGLHDKKYMKQYANFFVSLINAPFQLVKLEQHYWYEAKGYFQQRKAFIITSGFRLFRKKFIITELSVELQNYYLRPFSRGLYGTPISYGNKKYAVNMWFLDGTTRLKTGMLREINSSPNIQNAVQQHLGYLCELAEKIDSGQMKFGFLIEKPKPVSAQATSTAQTISLNQESLEAESILSSSEKLVHLKMYLIFLAAIVFIYYSVFFEGPGKIMPIKIHFWLYFLLQPFFSAAFGFILLQLSPHVARIISSYNRRYSRMFYEILLKSVGITLIVLGGIVYTLHLMFPGGSYYYSKRKAVEAVRRSILNVNIKEGQISPEKFNKLSQDLKNNRLSQKMSLKDVIDAYGHPYKREDLSAIKEKWIYKPSSDSPREIRLYFFKDMDTLSGWEEN